MSRTSHYLDCGCNSCVGEWIELAKDLEAKNKELEEELKTVKDKLLVIYTNIDAAYKQLQAERE